MLVPTRELAAQVRRELDWLGRSKGLRTVSIYGGVGFEAQRKALRKGVDVVVACPGRLADLIGQKALELSAVEIVVLDEADRMADMGFLPQVKKLLDQTSVQASDDAVLGDPRRRGRRARPPVPDGTRRAPRAGT